MSDSVVLVPFGVQVLALTREQFDAAVERGSEFMEKAERPERGNGQDSETLLTAEEMEGRTKVPATWYLEQARQGKVPHHRLGKYVRFLPGEILVCSRFREREKP